MNFEDLCIFSYVSHKGRIRAVFPDSQKKFAGWQFFDHFMVRDSYQLQIDRSQRSEGVSSSDFAGLGGVTIVVLYSVVFNVLQSLRDTL